MSTRAVIFFLSLVMAGCVTKGTYQELQSEYDAFKVEAEKRDKVYQSSVADLERALREERARLSKLTHDKAEVEKRLAAITDEKASLIKDKTRLQASEAEMKQALRDLAARRAQSEARVAAYRDLLGRFKSMIDSGKLSVRIIEGRMVVQLAMDILFASGSASLSRDGKDAIVEVTGILAGIPDREFQVAGHTDNIPIRTSAYRSNWELAYHRARTVVETMVDGGMPSARISAASYAEFRPVASNETDEGKAANRRIEIVVVPDLTNLPGTEELKQIGKASSPEG